MNFWVSGRACNFDLSPAKSPVERNERPAILGRAPKDGKARNDRTHGEPTDTARTAPGAAKAWVTTSPDDRLLTGRSGQPVLASRASLIQRERVRARGETILARYQEQSVPCPCVVRELSPLLAVPLSRGDPRQSANRLIGFPNVLGARTG
jgi:hypothetical protein